MKSFLIISDTHGRSYDEINSLISAINSCDALVHLGDGLGDLAPFRDRITAKILSVRGNCDISNEPDNIFVQTDAGKIVFTHGYTHNVKSGLLNLALFARENGCDYAFYGHTHIANEDYYLGVTMLNPGSLSHSRAQNPSYAVAYVDGKKLITKIITI